MENKPDVKYDQEKLQKDAQDFIDTFRKKMKSIADETLGELYVNIMPYLETDTWTNYREALRIELEHEYKYTKFKEEWAVNFRRAVFVENREEISKLIEKDILKRIKELEDLRQEFDMFRYSPGGDRYQDKLKELDQALAAIGTLRGAIISVCCDPEGTVCIEGSEEDRAVLQRALTITAEFGDKK